jgi:hypothetical protein
MEMMPKQVLSEELKKHLIGSFNSYQSDICFAQETAKRANSNRLLEYFLAMIYPN